MANRQGEQLSKADRKRMFSNTIAVIQDDPTDVRARLQLVDLLQQDGRTSDAVDELLRTAAVYVDRRVPIKAVAVLRQAVKLAPERAEVRVTYGEVFEKLRMVDDAAREYRLACDLFHAVGQHAAEVDSLARLVSLDAGNYGATVAVAEALHRVGRTERAAAMFRSLAEQLLGNGATSEWEMIAERICFLAPEDATTAHDLALHYVRSGRHAEALGKLIRCYEAEPNDVELLELIIDTLEYLGQHQHAAALTRQLIVRYRAGGLTNEADEALRRLHGLAPDDEEAQEAMGVLHGAIAEDSVLEFEDSGSLPSLDGLEEEDEIGFGGDFIDRLLQVDDGSAPQLARSNMAPPVLRSSGAHRSVGQQEQMGATGMSPIPDADDAPPLPDDAFEPPPEEPAAAPGAARVEPMQPRTVISAPPLTEETELLDVVPRRVQMESQPVAPVAARERAEHLSRLSAGDSQGFGPAGQPLNPSVLDPTAVRPGKITIRARPGARQPQHPHPVQPARHMESMGFGEPPDDDATEMLDVVQPRSSASRPRLRAPAMPRRGPATHPGASKKATAHIVRPRLSRTSVPAQPPVMPATAKKRDEPVLSPRGSPAKNKPARHSDTAPAVVAPPPDDDTIDEGGVPPVVPVVPVVPVPRVPLAPKAPTSTENTNLFLLEEDEEEAFGVEPEHTTIDPRAFELLDRLDVQARSQPSASNSALLPLKRKEPAKPADPATKPMTRTLTPMRRSSTLPRPRLARGRRSGADSRRKHGIETDLKTLDFFIERGFYESAAALAGELEKRYPHSEEMRARRRRITKMARK